MILTKHEFLQRFTIEEKAAILTAADQSPLVKVYLFDLSAAQDVDVCDAQTMGGVQALEAAGLLGAGRSAQILDSGEPSSAPIGTARILPPFDIALPDIYPIDSFNATTGVYTILGTEIDQQFVEVLT